MDNVTFYEVETISGVHSMALIANEDGSFTSMPKAVYDAQVEQANKPAVDVVQ